MPTRIYVEWLNANKAETLFEQRRAYEIAKARELEPNRPEEDIVSHRDQDSVWNWVDERECFESRTFPSLALAKEWVKINFKLDYFEKPRIGQNEWTDGQSEREAEMTLCLVYEGNGEWLNILTGETEQEGNPSKK